MDAAYVAKYERKATPKHCIKFNFHILQTLEMRKASLIESVSTNIPVIIGSNV